MADKPDAGAVSVLTKGGTPRKNRPPRHVNTFTVHRRDKYLEVVRTYGIKTIAAEAAGVCNETVRQYCIKNPDFRKEVDEAIEFYNDSLEVVAHKRAVDGWKEPVFYQGEEVGHVVKFDNSMLAKKLDAARPDKYNRRSVDQTQVDVNVNHGVLMVPTPIASMEQFEKEAQKLLDQQRRDGMILDGEIVDE